MKCFRCQGKGEVELIGGRVLCNACFLSYFEKRVRKTIRVNHLLKGDDRTAVALSGGKDSVVLLHILHKLHEKAPRASLSAISVDPGIPGFEKNISCARKACEELGVEHHVFCFKDELGLSMADVVEKIKALKNPSLPCTYCGVFRRKLLNDKAKELGFTKIATGHNLDDEIQTALMNFVRGEVDRIARMGPCPGVVRDPGFVPRIKPLRNSPESEILPYAKLKNLCFEPMVCPYSGEAFRKTIKEAIDMIDERHPGSRYQILNSTDRLASSLKENLESEKMGRCGICGDPCSGETCRVCQIKKDLGLF